MTRFSRLQAGLALLWALSLLVGWRPFVDTLVLSSRDQAYTHILLIIPISAALITQEWRVLRTMFAPSVLAGSLFLAVSAVAAGFASVWSASLPFDVQLTIKMSALVVWWIGAFVLCLGSRTAKLALFPLLMLFCMVPLPNVAVDWIVVLLQQGSAWSARALFVVFGIPIAQDGFLLTIPGLTVQVAQECSSIRSSSMLLVTTLVLAQVLLISPWRKILAVSIAVPLSIAKNGLRIFVIAMLGTRVDPGYLTGRFHHQGGIIFFSIALTCMFALLWLLRRGDGISQEMRAN